jgi:hypothetical protein
VPVLGDAWSWDGSSWNPISAAGGPSARYLQAMGTVGNKTIVFGGFDSGETYLGDAWVWDGAAWKEQHTQAPTARAFSATAAQSGGVVLFGGVSDNDALSDTWRWDGSNWTALSVSGPSARLSHTMAAQGQNIVLFGGTSGFANVADLGDTWVFNGSSWTPSKATGPIPRDGSTMASLGSTVVLFGGESYDVDAGAFDLQAGTWVWDGTSWTKTSANGPSPRLYSAVATFGNKVLLFGGFDATGPLGDTWVWDGTSWTQQMVTGGPKARCGHGMATR